MLTQEKETLLIPLYGKAMESKQADPILTDLKAEEILGVIEYDFKRLRIPRKTDIMMSLRARQFDSYVRSFMLKHSGGIVLHIGCGLDCRYTRINNKKSDWYELDFPEVIEIKKHFFQEKDTFHFISSSVTDRQWIQTLPESEIPVLIIAEGLFMYLKEEEIKALLFDFMKKYPHTRLIFDGFSKLTAKYAGNHPSLKKTGALLKWGIDDPAEMEEWADGISFVEDWYFSDSEAISKLSWGYRTMFKLAGKFKSARIAHRIFVFDLFGE